MPCPGLIGLPVTLPNGICVQTYCDATGVRSLGVVPCLRTWPMLAFGAKTPCGLQGQSPLPQPTCPSPNFTPSNQNLEDPLACIWSKP